jgi:hypothetical protein
MVPTIKDTLCWACAKACGGHDCPWAAELKPVRGWVAEETVRSYKDNLEIRSYRVIACPLYEKGRR